MASKYEALAEHLRRQSGRTVEMSFGDIEAIVGQLPKAAWAYRAWWSNNTSFTHARNGWLAAGRKTARVSMEDKRLSFVLASAPASESTLGLAGPRTASARRMHFDMSPRGSARDTAEQEIGADNLVEILRAIQRYVDGEIVETELGRIIRKYWRTGGERP